MPDTPASLTKEESLTSVDLYTTYRKIVDLMRVDPAVLERALAVDDKAIALGLHEDLEERTLAFKARATQSIRAWLQMRPTMERALGEGWDRAPSPQETSEAIQRLLGTLKAAGLTPDVLGEPIEELIQKIFFSGKANRGTSAVPVPPEH